MGATDQSRNADLVAGERIREGKYSVFKSSGANLGPIAVGKKAISPCHVGFPLSGGVRDDIALSLLHDDSGGISGMAQHRSERSGVAVYRDDLRQRCCRLDVLRSTPKSGAGYRLITIVDEVSRRASYRRYRRECRVRDQMACGRSTSSPGSRRRLDGDTRIADADHRSARAAVCDEAACLPG